MLRAIKLVMSRRIKIRTVTFEVRETATPYAGRLTDSPAAAAAAARAVIDARGLADRENFVVLYLNSRTRLVGAELTSIGTVNSALVHPREVFRGAIAEGASRIILAHNHPTGDVTPSPEDLTLRRRVQEAGTLLGIPVEDFIVISATSYWSYVESGR